jgi:hypothetical protein
VLYFLYWTTTYRIYFIFTLTRCYFLQENPCQHPVVILKDVSAEDVEALLSFMYQGEVYISQERLSSFLRTAELLQVRGLTGASAPSSNLPATDLVRNTR